MNFDDPRSNYDLIIDASATLEYRNKTTKMFDYKSQEKKFTTCNLKILSSLLSHAKNKLKGQKDDNLHNP